MVPKDSPPPALQRLKACVYQMFVAVALYLFSGASTPAATYYNVTFEEPVHHANQLPTLGGAPDKPSTINTTQPEYSAQGDVYPPPTVVSTASGQSLLLVTAYPHLHMIYRAATFAAPVTANPNLTFTFDVQFSYGGNMNIGLPGGGVGLFFQGYDHKLFTAAFGKYLGTVGTGVQHFSIEVAPDIGLWIGKINGVEVWREPYSATQAPGLSFGTSYQFAGSVAVQNAYVDNIVVADTAEVNQPPSFTSGGDIVAPEDAPYSMQWATNVSAGAGEPNQSVAFQVTNDNAALFSVAPTMSPAGVLAFTPAPNAFGRANLTVRLVDTGGTVNGGVNATATQTFAIDVANVNDPPTLDPVADFAVPVDSSERTVNLTGITVGPSNETATLEITATSSNLSVIPTPQVVYTSPEATGALKFTPAPGASGNVTITVTVAEAGSPGVQVSRAFVVKVTSDPTFTKGPDAKAQEDVPFSYANWPSAVSLGAADPQDPVSWEITTDNATLFSAGPAIAADGTLTFTSAQDANGHANATVRLHAGSRVSDPQTFAIDIAAVNDAPTLVVPGAVTVVADGQEKQYTVTGVTAGPPNEPQYVRLSVSSSNGYGYTTTPTVTYSAASGTAVVKFTPLKSGTVSFTVEVDETGPNGEYLSNGRYAYGTTAVTIQDDPNVQKPTFTPGPQTVTVATNSGAYQQPWATNIVNSHGNTSTATLQFSLFTSGSASSLFSAQPSISNTGVLTFTPAANQSGSASVMVQLRDTSVASGNPAAISDSVSFTIQVNSAPGSPPSFTAGPNVTVAVDSGPYQQPWATQIVNSQGTSATANLQFTVTNNNASLFSAAPSVGSDGRLAFVPASGAVGSAQVSVTLRDTSQVPGGGTDVSATKQFTITVTPVANPPSFTAGPNVTVPEDSNAYQQPWGTQIVNSQGTSATTNLQFTVANNNASLFSVAPSVGSDGRLAFVPAKDANGAAQVSVTLRDTSQVPGGGTDVSATKQFTITVTPVNDPPSFIAGNSLTLPQSARIVALNGWATQVRPGPADESAQTVQFEVSVDHPELFSSAPSLFTNGNFNISPAGTAGTATLSIMLRDSAGSVSQPVTRTITFAPSGEREAYHLDFEEPSHHLGQTVSIGSAPAKPSTVNGTPDIVAAPAGLTGQALRLWALNIPGSDAASNVGLVSPLPAPSNFSLSFDLVPKLGSGGVFSLAFTVPYTLKVSLEPDGFIHLTTTMVNGESVDHKLASYSNDALLHFNIDLSADLQFSVGRVNGQELWREPWRPGSMNCTFSCSQPTAGPYHEPYAAYLDNVVISSVDFNQPPAFTGGPSLTVAEDTDYSQPWATGISAGLGEVLQGVFFDVTTDNPSLFSTLPAISATGRLTFKTAPDAYGQANLWVRLYDAGGTAYNAQNFTPPQSFTINVTSVDDPPTLDPLKDLAVWPNSPQQLVSLTGISAGPAGESGALQITATSSNPAVIPTPEIVYSSPDATGVLKFTPAPDARGQAVIQVTVQELDQPASRVTRSFTVDVTTKPIIKVIDGIVVKEDSGLNNDVFFAIIKGDADPNAPVSFDIDSDNNALFAALSVKPYPYASPGNYFVSFMPAPNAHGHANVTLRLHVGDQVSDPRTFTVDVTPVDDPPKFTVPLGIGIPNDGLEHEIAITGIAPGAPDEEANFAVTVATTVITNAAIETPTVAYTSPHDMGVVKFKTVAGQTGQVAIHVIVSEAANPQNATTKTVTVNVFDQPAQRPSFYISPDFPVLEDSARVQGTAALQIKNSFGGTSTDSLQFTVQVDKPELFSEQPALSPQGVITFRVAPEVSGVATLTITLTDDAQSPPAASIPQQATITITPLNDPPSFVAGESLKVVRGSGPQVIQHWATAISAGPADEASQTLHFSIVLDHPEYFAEQPKLSADGTLTFTPATNKAGTAHLAIVLEDNGGGARATATALRTIEITRSVVTPGAYRALVHAPMDLVTVGGGAPPVVPPTHNSQAGLVSLNVTPTGQFTGRLTLSGGRVFPLKGVFNSSGTALFSPRNQPGLPLERGARPLVLGLSWSDDETAPRLLGSLTRLDVSIADIHGGLAVFVTSGQPEAPFRNIPADLVGRYNVALSPAAAPPSSSQVSEPKGHGYGSLIVSRTGSVVFLGHLPDNTVVTYSGPILGDLRLPLYAPIKGGRGSLSGFVQFRDVPNVSDVDSPALFWSRPVARVALGIVPALDGFQLTLVGSKYNGAGFAGLKPPTFTDYAAMLDLTGRVSGVAAPFSVPVQITSGVTADTTDSPLTLTINAQTGEINGAYKFPSPFAASRYRGVILSKQSTAYGYFTDQFGYASILIAPQ